METLTKNLTIVKEDKLVRFNFQDRQGTFSFRWLKDHSLDQKSFDPSTRQRLTETASINNNDSLQSIEVDEQSKNVMITWSQWQDSILPIELLYDNSVSSKSTTGNGTGGCGADLQLWKGDTLTDGLPEADFTEVFNDSEAEKDWLEKLHRYGFVLVKNTPDNLASTQKIIEKIGYVRSTIYGGMWEFGEGFEYEDSAYTSKGIGPHTDGTYSLDPPGLQILHCLKFEGTGGESILVDGFKVAEDLKNEHPQSFDLLSSLLVPGQYLGKGVQLKAQHPVIRLGGNGRLKQVCYNNYDRAPFSLPFDEMEKFYDALKLFQEKISSESYQIKFTLESRKPLFFDNWRVLHARTSYTGSRRLCGGYINREDYESRLRVNGIGLEL